MSERPYYLTEIMESAKKIVGDRFAGVDVTELSGFGKVYVKCEGGNAPFAYMKIAFDSGRVRVNSEGYPAGHLPAGCLRDEDAPSIEPWDGQGLPPPGTECEFSLNRGQVEWVVGTVIGNDGPHQVVLKYGRGEYHARNIHGVRPIRTPEQIKAEERENAAKAMYLSIFFKESESSWELAPERLRETWRLAIDKGWRQDKE